VTARWFDYSDPAALAEFLERCCANDDDNPELGEPEAEGEEAAPESTCRDAPPTPYPAVDGRWNARAFEDSFVRPLPTIPWLCPDLEIGPGRPNGIVGAPSAGKSDMAQTIAVGVAAGVRIYDRFDCRRGRVAHIALDMGTLGVELRYRRLAAGLGVTPDDLRGRLVVLSRPSILLTTPNAEQLFADLFAEFDLVIVDTLRDAMPGIDENDSRVGQYVHLLGGAAEAAGRGTSVLFLHHSPKNAGGVRGSGAIKGASGAVWEIEGERDEPRRVSHFRQHDLSQGVKPDFWIARAERPGTGFDLGGFSAIVYTAHETDPTGGGNGKRARGEPNAEQLAKVRAYVESLPPGTPLVARHVATEAGVDKGCVNGALRILEGEGLVMPRARKADGSPNGWDVA
jgi:hypothetical protein